MKKNQARRDAASWVKHGAAALLTLALATLPLGCGSSGGGSSHDGGSSGADAGPHTLCVDGAADPMSCFAPTGNVQTLCESTYVAAGSACLSQAEAYLRCALPGPGDAGSCVDCMDAINAYNDCILGR